MYQNFIFDLYGTLVDIHTDEEDVKLWEKMALFYSYQGAFYDKDELRDTYGRRAKSEADKFPKEDMYPEIDLTSVFRGLYQEKGQDPSEELVIYTAQMFRALSTEYVRLYDGAANLLETLKSEKKHLFLLTNAQRIFTEYELKLLGISQYFDDIIISSDCGCKKPDQSFFDILIKKHNLCIKESVMIGNDGGTDIAGANKVGMDSFYLHSNLSPDILVRPKSTYSLMPLDLYELSDILIHSVLPS